MFAGIVYYSPQQPIGDSSRALFRFHEHAGQMPFVRILWPVFLFEDRQADDLAIDVGTKCHDIVQPLKESVHRLLGFALVNRAEHFWRLLQGRQSDGAKILHIGGSKPTNLNLTHRFQFSLFI